MGEINRGGLIVVILTTTVITFITIPFESAIHLHQSLSVKLHKLESIIGMYYISVVSNFNNISVVGEVFMLNNFSKGNVLSKARLLTFMRNMLLFCTNHL